MAKIRSVSYYWLLGLMVLYVKIPFCSSQVAPLPPVQPSVFNYGPRTCSIYPSSHLHPSHRGSSPMVRCQATIGSNNMGYGTPTPYTEGLASLLLTCIDEVNNHVNAMNLSECIQAFRNNYVCWVFKADNLMEAIKKALNESTCATLDGFYGVVNNFNQACDFKKRKEQVEDLLDGVNADRIKWNEINKPVVACIIPLRLCNNTAFKMRLNGLLEDKTNCTDLTNTMRGCCPEQCSCLSVLKDEAQKEKCDLDLDTSCKSSTPMPSSTPIVATTTAIKTTCVDDSDMVMCSKKHFQKCNFPGDKLVVSEHIKDTECSCETVPEIWEVVIEKCSDKPKTLQHVMALDNLADSSRVEERYYSQIVQMLQYYIGDKKAAMKYPTAAKIISRASIDNLTLDGLLNYVENFTDPKLLALVRQTLTPLEIPEDRSAKLRMSFINAGCPLLSGVSLSTLEEPGNVNLQLAMDMCDCSEQQQVSTPAKINALCEVIIGKVYYGVSSDKFGDFVALLDTLCARCLVHSLNTVPDWKRRVLDNTQFLSSACDIIGNSTALSTQDLMEWAGYCTVSSQASGCRRMRPSLMAYQSSPPTPSHLAICKGFFCTRLCRITSQELNTIKQALNQNHNQDVGCLTYLDDNISMKTSQQPVVDHKAIPGSCLLRSTILKRAPRRTRQRRQATSCTGECNEVEYDISREIPPPDVLDVSQIATCGGATVVTCIKDHSLGEFRWDVDQAKALLKLIRQSGTFDVAVENWSSEDLEILGFIGVGFTPEELKMLGGLTDAIFEVFGVAHGWSPQQRQALAQRYLRDKGLQPHNLTPVNLAQLNHIVCGLLPNQVKAIPRQTVADSTTFLGDLRRCDIGVLMELAAHLKRHYGDVGEWVEDHFSEFGIILAGLRGEDLRRAGRSLSDHVTVPFINHIPPAEFRKLSPAQTRLFPYVVAQAISRRGLCPWLDDRHKQGNLRTACSRCTYIQPRTIQLLLLLLFVFISNFFSSLQEI